MSMKNRFARSLLVLALLAFPALASAQTSRDTVVITINGMMSGVTITALKLDGSSAGSNFKVGDTVQFTAHAFDADGDSVGAIMTWWTNQPSFVQIDSVSGLAVMLRKANPSDNVLVIVQANQVDGMTVGWFRPGKDPAGTIRWTRPIPIDALQANVQLCAYLTYHGTIVAQSEAPCPDVAGVPPMYQVNVDGQTYQAPQAWHRRIIEGWHKLVAATDYRIR